MHESGNPKQSLTRAHIEKLEALLHTMKYGSITLVVQDGKIIQMDKTEKYRLKNE